MGLSEKAMKNIILFSAKQKYKKSLERDNKQIDKLMEKYKAMDPFKNTKKQLWNIRFRLDSACQHRDEIKRYIEVIEKMERGEI